MNLQKNSAPPIVCMHGVSFAYNHELALDNVNLDIGKGEFACIVGPNGGGKSTMLKLILGLLQPNKGHVRVFGHEPQLGRCHIGYTPQHVNFDPLFPVSVLEVTLMGLVNQKWGGAYSREQKTLALDTLRKVGMADFARKPFSALSGGQRQRVLIARALAPEPELLLLDEPTANVDAAAARRLMGVLKELNETMTIVMVSHEPSLVSDSVSQVICVNTTVLTHPTGLLTTEELREAYGDDVRLVRHDKTHSETEHRHE